MADKDSDDLLKKKIFHKCGKLLFQKWIVDLLDQPNFTFDGDWDDDFQGGKILYLLGRKLEDLAGIKETHSYEDDLTEDECFLEFRRACSKLGIPTELIFADEDWDDIADGEKIMITLEALYKKYVEVTNKGQVVAEKEKKTKKRPQSKWVPTGGHLHDHDDHDDQADVLNKSFNIGNFFSNMFGHESKYKISEYDPKTAHLLGDQDILIEAWPLFSLTKHEGNYQQFEKELEKLAKVSQEEWEKYQKLHNTHHSEHLLKPLNQRRPTRSALNLPDYVEDINERKRFLVEVVGVFGETCMHLCCLFNNFTLFSALVLKFPNLLNEPYLHKIYSGETCLHMLISKGRDAEIQFVIHHNVNLEAACRGSFFKPHPGRVYSGEYPLSFAINISKIEIAKKITTILIEAGAHMGSHDRFGNNILHNCVYNNNAEMYSFIHENWPAECETLDKRLNSKGLTPLQYAAGLGHREMFECLIKTRRIFLWKYLNSANYAYPLEEIDSLVLSNSDEDKPRSDSGSGSVEMQSIHTRFGSHKVKKDPRSAVEMLVYAPGLSVEEKRERAQTLDIPFIHQLIFNKWTAYAGAIFYTWLFFYMTFLGAYTYFVIWHDELITKAPSVFWGLLSFLLAFSIASSLVEIFDMIRMRLIYLFQDSFPFHLMALLYSSFTMAYFGLAFHGGANINCNLNQVYENVANNQTVLGNDYMSPSQLPEICVAANTCLSLASFFAWLHLFFFARGFPSLALFIISLREVLAKDLFPFIIVFFTWTMAFSVGLYPLWNSDPFFNTFGSALYTTLQLAIYSINFLGSDISNGNPPAIIGIIILLIIFILGVMMTNMLIAATSKTYQEIQDQAHDQHYFEFVSTILMLERRTRIFFWLFSFKLDQNITIPSAPGMHFRVEEEEEDLEEDDD